jgi:HK97 family phage major capsid protein
MNTEDKLVQAMTGLVGIQQYLVGLPDRETVGDQILKSNSFEKFKDGGSDMANIELKTAITSTGTINDPLVPSMKPPIDAGVRRNLTVRDLLRSFPTTNGAIEMPVKSAATNNAAPQVGESPLQRENTAMGESAHTFTNTFMPVQTIGHFVPASTQIFEDAGTLDGFIQGELSYGLQLAIEDQLLNGTGTTGTLTGLLTGATAYTLRSPNLTGEADVIRDAMRQVCAADFRPTAILLNPADWYDLDTNKASASDDTYTAGGPRLMDTPRLWGLPVVETCNYRCKTTPKPPK